MIIIEFDISWPWSNFGKFRSTMSGKKYIRIWLGIIAITYTQFSQRELYDYVSEGNTIWTTEENQ